MRWPKPSDVSLLWRHEFRLDFRALERRVIEHPEAVILGLGTALRIAAYLWNRPMWLDEMMLKGNIEGVRVLHFSEPLKSHQMAPFGFLIAERALAAVVGTRNYVLRSIPLAAGLAALWLFGRLVRDLLPRRAALVALALFAFSDDLIYYSSEFKPYTLDLAFGVAITLAAAGAVGRQPSTRAVVWLAVLAAAAPWFSFPSAFVIAGCGLVLLIDALRSARLTTSLIWVLLGLLWLANFVVCYRASQTQLVQASPMWGFWHFAFLPLTWPPTRDGLLKSAGLLLEVFVNPLNLLAPGGSLIGVIVPLLLLIAGGLSWARRSATTVLLLVLPIALAIIASVLGRYPFHGRLILELVPALFLLIAAGTEWVAHRFPTRSGIVYKTLLLALLTFPCWYACSSNLQRRDRGFNSHGDLHDNVFIDIRVKGQTPARLSGA
jgi:hypothetical protein